MDRASSPQALSRRGMISGLAVRQFWEKIPAKVMLAMIFACLLIGEAYPFSNFPMFGSFSGKTYYVYLADETGKAIPALNFGVPTNGIKKAYDGRLRRLKKRLGKKGRISPEQDRTAAEETLRYLVSRRPYPTGQTALRLVRVDLRLERGELVKETRTAGELSLR